jgi:hypothetical protein
MGKRSEPWGAFGFPLAVPSAVGVVDERDLSPAKSPTAATTSKQLKEPATIVRREITCRVYRPRFHRSSEFANGKVTPRWSAAFRANLW